jgi:hypothetical protein
MVKLVEITSCGTQCPYNRAFRYKVKCDLAHKTIRVIKDFPNNVKFPSWCPLVTKEE